MKILPVLVIILTGLLASGISRAQDTNSPEQVSSERMMLDTTIEIDPHFFIIDRYAASDSIHAFKIWASKMHDTTIEVDPSFAILNTYAERDSIDNLYGGFASRRDSLVHALRDSLNAIGSALLRTADMQDTTIQLDHAFVISEIYAERDRREASRDSLKASMVMASTMHDTTIEMEASFLVLERYAQKDRYDHFRDSVWSDLAESAKMRDTVIELESGFVVREMYATSDRMDAVRDSLAKPATMQDTTIQLESAFVIQDLYPAKDAKDALRDSLKIIRDSVVAVQDSLRTDSVQRHWAGWKKYEIQPALDYTLNSQKILKGSSKTVLQYNIADVYLYLNGEQVKPPASNFDFFSAGCLAFNSDDTVLINSGLGSKAGVGIGIKIFDERVSGSLHANTRNEEVYKVSEDDSTYLRSLTVNTVSQSLKLRSDPAYGGDVLLGIYQASFKKFYQKNSDGMDEEKKYNVRVVFKCRVTGGFGNRLK